MPPKGKTRPHSASGLKKEVAALRSTLDNIWGALVDIDDASSREEALDAIDAACEVMAADWPNSFEITDELSPRVKEQVAREEQLNKLAEEAEKSEDMNERAILFRKALAVQLGIDEKQIEQQVKQLTPQEYLELMPGLFWLIASLTAGLPMNYRLEVDRLVSGLKEFKKTLPRKHGPDEDPIISEAQRIRDQENKPYKAIYVDLLDKYREQMLSRGITPEIIAKRVRSRRSRLKKKTAVAQKNE